MGLTIEQIKERYEDGKFVFQLSLEQIKKLQQEGFFVIATHDGACHADDVFAVEAFKMSIAYMKQKTIVVRTRDKDILMVANACIDVGGVSNGERYCFDHHQEGGAGHRKGGLPFASFGLVWKFLGMGIVENYLSGKGYTDLTPQEVKYILVEVDKRLVQPIDAYDCGIDMDSDFNLGELVAFLRPTFREREMKTQKTPDRVFEEMCGFAELILKRYIAQICCEKEINERILVQLAKFPGIPALVLDFGVRMAEISSVLKNYPHIKVVIIDQNPKKGETWTVNIPRESTASFPEEWLGKEPEYFSNLGYRDVVFCHTEGFTLTCKSLSTALSIAQEITDHV